MSLLRSLSNDALIDILLYCNDDLQSVMNFAMTCSEFYHIVTECSERFWIFILNKLIDQRSKKNTTGKAARRKGFKPKTLSILEDSVKMADKSKQLISIIRTQLRNDRKHQLLAKYYDLPLISRYKYFSTQVEQIKDKYLRKIMEKKRVESLAYSPENIIKEKFNNCPLALIDIYMSNLPIRDFIDALFRKQDAHLYLDVHNRTMSSYLYDYWKEEYGRKNMLAINYRLVWFRNSLHLCRDLDSCLLWLKFIYLEFPNFASPDSTVDETAYEQDKHSETKGSFKGVLRCFATPAGSTQGEACDIIAKELYGNTNYWSY